MKRQLLLSLSCAFLTSLAFPPFKLGFLAYWALIPLFLLFEDMSVRSAFRWGYITGLFISLGTVYWIFLPTPAGAVATILVHPVFLAVFAAGYVFVRKHAGRIALLAVPFLWTAMEYVKSLGELAFPWVLLGYTQTYYLTLIQYASWSGVYGVSFWIVVLNVCVYGLWRHKSNTKASLAYAGAFFALILIPHFYGAEILRKGAERSSDHMYVAIAQGNIDPYQKWEKELREMNFQVYEKLSRRVPADSFDILIWPETATPTYLLHDRRNFGRVLSLARELQTPILTGTPDYIRTGGRSYKTFNSVVLIDDRPRKLQKYDKVHLVPFGERVPYEDTIPLFKKLLSRFEMGEGNFSPGTAIRNFQLYRSRPADGALMKPVKLGTVICFESSFPALVSEFVRRGAQLIVVVTNDGWFGRTAAPYQHAQMAVFRAIENRRSIARSANTGVSMTVDPFGRIRKQTRIFEEAVIQDSLPLYMDLTFYTKHGDIFAKFTLFFSLVSITSGPVWAAWKRKSRMRA